MWEHFGKRVLHVQNGGKPDMRWVRRSYIGHALLMDIHRSMMGTCEFIETDWTHLKATLGDSS